MGADNQLVSTLVDDLSSMGLAFSVSGALGELAYLKASRPYVVQSGLSRTV